MSVFAQVARLCAVAIAASLVQFAFRGLPSSAAGAASDDGGSCRAPAPPLVAPLGARWITQEEAHALVDKPDVVFVDCRPQRIFAAGHVSGAVHWDDPVDHPADDLTAPIPESKLLRLRSARLVITYCDAQARCERSFQLAQRLLRAGLTDVRVLEDGMPMWVARGYPAESGACEQCEPR